MERSDQVNHRRELMAFIWGSKYSHRENFPQANLSAFSLNEISRQCKILEGEG